VLVAAAKLAVRLAGQAGPQDLRHSLQREWVRGPGRNILERHQ